MRNIFKLSVIIINANPNQLEVVMFYFLYNFFTIQFMYKKLFNIQEIRCYLRQL